MKSIKYFEIKSKEASSKAKWRNQAYEIISIFEMKCREATAYQSIGGIISNVRQRILAIENGYIEIINVTAKNQSSNENESVEAWRNRGEAWKMSSKSHRNRSGIWPNQIIESGAEEKKKESGIGENLRWIEEKAGENQWKASYRRK